MAYGAPTYAPMVLSTEEPNRTPPEPLPDIQVTAIPEIGSNILKRLPAMPNGDNLSFSNYREQQVAEEMAAIRQATNIHKQYNKWQKAKGKAKDRAAQRWAEGR